MKAAWLRTRKAVKGELDDIVDEVGIVSLALFSNFNLGPGMGGMETSNPCKRHTRSLRDT